VPKRHELGARLRPHLRPEPEQHDPSRTDPLPARGTSGELKRRIRLGEVIALRLDPPTAAWLAEAPGVLRCVAADGWVECTVDEAEKRLPELLRALHVEGVVVRNVQVREPDLEDVFVELAR